MFRKVSLESWNVLLGIKSEVQSLSRHKAWAEWNIEGILYKRHHFALR